MNKKRLPCGNIFRSPVIRCDGSLTVCNYDLCLDLKLGDFKSQSLKELWDGEKINDLRIAHIKGKGLPEKCQKCKPDFTLSREDTVKWLKQRGYAHLISQFLARTAKVKLLLVNPLVSPKAPFKTCVTLGLGSIASFVQKDFEVEILNMNYSSLTNFDVAKYAKENDLTIVGVTAMTYQVKGGINLIRVIKEIYPDCITIFGGVFATMSPETIMEESKADFVIRGEGEKPLLNLLKAIDKSKPFKDIPSLVYRTETGFEVNPLETPLPAEEIPIIDRKLLPTFGFIFDDSVFGDSPENMVSVVVMFSRGCPSNCIFCESPHMWGRRVRMKPMDMVFDEIKYIIAEYGIKNFVIDDDSFTASKKNVRAFCERLILEDLNIKWRCNTKVSMVDKDIMLLMKKAGCVKVTYGVESGNPQVLKNLRKSFTIEQVKKALSLNKETGLPGSMLMIIGSPGETPETVKDSLSLIEELEPSGGFDFQIMQPHPGTDLRREIDTFGGKILTDDWDEYYSDNITYIPEGFDQKEFLSWCKKITRRPVKIAGIDKVSFSKEEGNTVNIPVDMWDNAYFDRLEAFYWKGDDGFSKGYTHTLGADSGHISYNFTLKKLCSKLKIRFYACSQHMEEKSEIDVLINSYKVDTIQIDKKDAYGFLYEIEIDKEQLEKAKVVEGINTLTFKIEKGPLANGISIMYKALENHLPQQERPITIYCK
ncbi:MAG: hypothetical protein C0601_13060 [Candidatus Muiribacterium halophilum]|uniref:Uncharacterized protein n=1 Tax=Muiribacterium halophilum TaxID=2053465 RepID=A0A2N5Z9N3_MUIH1|nr:MAG: hypothetical protein C0601_13060 [Candidatus Muirbacterium halophilum]